LIRGAVRLRSDGCKIIWCRGHPSYKDYCRVNPQGHLCSVGSPDATPANFMVIMWTLRAHREIRRQQAFDYLGNVCCECGNPDKRVLEFHYSKERRNNRATIGGLLSGSWERLQKHLGNCEVVCANCHKIKSLQEEKHIN
jgi:hypothetical protein